MTKIQTKFLQLTEPERNHIRNRINEIFLSPDSPMWNENIEIVQDNMATVVWMVLLEMGYSIDRYHSNQVDCVPDMKNNMMQINVGPDTIMIDLSETDE